MWSKALTHVGRVSLTVSLILIPHFSYSASFDCNLAKTNIENIICSEPEVSRLDEKLSSIYSHAMDKLKNTKDLKKDQLNWMKERDMCETKDCIIHAYTHRVDAIEALLKKSQHSTREDDCTDRPECWPPGSSMRTGLSQADELHSVESSLRKRHQALVDLIDASDDPNGIDGRLINALKKQQSAWIQYRDHECELVGSITGAGGTWPSTYATMCKLDLTEERIRAVDSVMTCMTEIPPEKRKFERARCLNVLTPLTDSPLP